MDKRIKKFVYRVRNRIREQSVIDYLTKSAGVGMLIAVILSLLALVVPFYEAVLLAAIVIVVSFLVGIILGIRKTPVPMHAALHADAKGHHEKISTAFYLAGKEDAFSSLQKKDALHVIEQFEVRKEFPIRMPVKAFALLVGLSVAFIVSNMIVTPAKRVANTRHEVAKEAKEEIAQLEKLEKELQNMDELSGSEVDEMQKQLDQAKKELKEAQSHAELKKAQERIVQKIEKASKNVKDKTVKEMLASAAEEGKERQTQKEEALTQEAKKALEKEAEGSKKDKEEAYEKLKELAETTGDSKLSQAAQEYKDSSYSEESYAKANQALQQAGTNGTMSDYAASSENSNQNASQGQNSQSQNGKGHNSNAGNQTGNNANQQGENGVNQQSGNNSNGASQGNGTGQGNGSGNGAGGGSGWNYGSKEGTEGENKKSENVTIPDGKLGDDENLTGQANNNDSSTKEKSNESKTWSGNKVNYDEVSGKYKEKAHKKVNGSSYPGKIKEKIKDYFNGLN